MSANKKIVSFFYVFLFTIVFAGVFLPAYVSAQPVDLTKKYLDASNEQFSSGNYKKAFEYVNRALQLNENGQMPESVVLMAENIYSSILTQISTDKDYTLFNEVTDSLEKYPVIADAAIKKQVSKIYAQQETELTEKRDAEAAAERDQTRAFYQNQLDEQRKSQESLMATLNQGLDTIGQGISDQAEKNEQANHAVFVAVLVVCGILLIIFGIIIFAIYTASRAQLKQQEQFEATLKLVAGMQDTNNRVLLGGVTGLYGTAGLKSAGSSRWGMDALPEPELNPEEQKELKDLAIACEDLGSKIDQATKRKNNSKNVSELVYKLSVQLGLNQNTAMVYFCAAMVYDAGFLSFKGNLLKTESLTEEQKEKIRTHVHTAESFFHFVPEKYRAIFTDAAEKHHENMDGSGYPDGIAGDQIPHIAKLIHVAESYTSLISHRDYRAIRDKESAVKELVSKPELYDAAVVAALDAIV